MSSRCRVLVRSALVCALIVPANGRAEPLPPSAATQPQAMAAHDDPAPAAGTNPRAVTRSLSVNSGIDASDTYAVFDITLQDQRSFTAPASASPVTPAPALSRSFSHGAKHFHMEIGFDTADNLVANITPTDAATDPTRTQYAGVGKIAIRGERLFLYDPSGQPIPVVMPDGGPPPNILTRLGLHPFPSPLTTLVVANPQTVATAIHGTYQSMSPTAALVSAVATAPATSRTTINYVKSGTSWLLSSKIVSGSTANSNWSYTLSIANLTWNDSATGDTRRGGYSPTLAPGTATSYTALAPALPSLAATSPTGQTTVAGGANGSNVLFQHGFLSSGATWSRMTGWLESDFKFNDVLVPSLSSISSLSTQTAQLQSVIAGSGASSYLAIGHSAGGLISRNVAQLNQGQVRGVVTVDTTHLGAMLLNNSQGLIDEGLVYLFNNLLADACDQDALACDLAFVAGDAAIAGLVSFGFSTAVPASADLAYLSPYTTNLNAVAETFPRVGISGYSDQRWLLFRLIGDLACNPDDACGGRAVATYTEYVYDGLTALGILDALIADEYYSEGDDDDGDFYEFQSQLCFQAVNDFDNIDDFWDSLVTTDPITGQQDSTSDGIVQGTSQTYPHATTANYIISGADSHVGATRSSYVRTALDQVLAQQFFTPITGCSFTVSPGSSTSPFQGEELALAVNGAAGCAWTAVSNVPWIEDYWGMSGSGPGTAAFIVEINLGGDTRTGTLTVGGQTVTITQPGIAGNVGQGSVTLARSPRGWPPQPEYVCAIEDPNCKKPVPPTETITITVNGHADSLANVGPFLQEDAFLLASNINNDAAAPVYAGTAGGTLYLVSKVTVGGDYAYSVGITWGPNTDFYPPPVPATPSGTTLVGSN
jgi:pimeloyl-ACP methyl ester carboxylesterase